MATHLCGQVLIYKTDRPSDFKCTLPDGHTPAERHENVVRGRRWTEQATEKPNRADRRAAGMRRRGPLALRRAFA
jgi:hypothetical protein